MLIGCLYHINQILHNGGIIEADVILNPDHSIFKGHYPGQPVLPGACMLQILKDVLELGLNGKVAMLKASQMKFLQMIAPSDKQTLRLKITHGTEDGIEKVVAILSLADAACFKFNGHFKKI